MSKLQIYISAVFCLVFAGVVYGEDNVSPYAKPGEHPFDWVYSMKLRSFAGYQLGSVEELPYGLMEKFEAGEDAPYSNWRYLRDQGVIVEKVQVRADVGTACFDSYDAIISYTPVTHRIVSIYFNHNFKIKTTGIHAKVVSRDLWSGTKYEWTTEEEIARWFEKSMGERLFMEDGMLFADNGNVSIQFETKTEPKGEQYGHGSEYGVTRKLSTAVTVLDVNLLQQAKRENDEFLAELKAKKEKAALEARQLAADYKRELARRPSIDSFCGITFGTRVTGCTKARDEIKDENGDWHHFDCLEGNLVLDRAFRKAKIAHVKVGSKSECIYEVSVTMKDEPSLSDAWIREICGVFEKRYGIKIYDHEIKSLSESRIPMRGATLEIEWLDRTIRCIHHGYQQKAFKEYDDEYGGDGSAVL